MSAARRQVGSWLVLVVCGIYFLLPMLAMARFSFQNVPAARFGTSTLFDGWSLRGVRRLLDDDGFWPALRLSLELAVGAIVVTLGLLLPTALWVHLRALRWRPVVELLTILPYVVPPIALVVGVAGTFRTSAPWFLASRWALVPFYAVVAMPFTYRVLDNGLRAIDLRTLSEAARGLGAGWWTTLGRVVLPNIRSAVIGAAFLTATVVLGEFTIAALLLKETLPTYMAQFQRNEPQGGMALALLSLVATTLLLGLAGRVASRRRGRAAVTIPAGI